MREQIEELAGIVKVLVRGLQATGDFPDWMDKELFMLSVKLTDLIHDLEPDEDAEA